MTTAHWFRENTNIRTSAIFQLEEESILDALGWSQSNAASSLHLPDG
jgi:hypothetical protein